MWANEMSEVNGNASRPFSCRSSLFERYADLKAELGGNEIIYTYTGRLTYEMGRSKAKLATEHVGGVC